MMEMRIILLAKNVKSNIFTSFPQNLRCNHARRHIYFGRGDRAKVTVPECTVYIGVMSFSLVEPPMFDNR